MNASLSINTQAILLLTAPLLVGRSHTSNDLLTPVEYKRLARHLRDTQHQPGDLISPNADEVLHSCRSIIEEARLRRLLDRGFLLSQALERWQTRAIWVISRADAAYPRRIKTQLKEGAPPVLYGCGNAALLETGGLAVVGSRDVDTALLSYTEAVGRLTAEAKQTLISGGARGIDQAAMRGALNAGGRVVGVLAERLEAAALNRDNRRLLLDGQLVLVSAYDPCAGFNVGHAMQRNKLIYAFADAALVANSDLNKGGTWAGAIEQLEELHLVPVYVRTTGEPARGLEALLKKGAVPWPNPDDAAGLIAALHTRQTREPSSQTQAELPLSPRPPALQAVSDISVTHYSEQSEGKVVLDAANAISDPATELFCKVSELVLRLLDRPKDESEVASALQVNPLQAKDWLRRLKEEGLIEKNGTATSYTARVVKAQEA